MDRDGMARDREPQSAYVTPSLIADGAGNVLSASPEAIALLGGESLARRVPESWSALLARCERAGTAHALSILAGGRTWVATAVSTGDGRVAIALAPSSTACSSCSGDGRYRALIDAIRDGVLIADLDENITFANQAACAMLGYSEHELREFNMRELVGSEDFARIRTETAQRVRGERNAYEVRMRAKSGANLTIMISAAPLMDDHGQVTGAIGILRDVTERRAVERELEAGRRRLASQNRTLTLMARDPAVHAGDLDNALFRITEATARTLNVESASVWLFDRGRGDLVCADAFEDAKNRHARGQRIRVAACRDYLAAVERDRLLAVTNANADARTVELASAEDGVRRRERALLDVPIRSMGRLIGVLRHEAPAGRTWTPDEQLFVVALADLIARVAENGERHRIEEEIRAIARFPDENPQPVLRATREGTVLYANLIGRQVLTAWSRGLGRRLPEELAKVVTDSFDSGSQATTEIGSDGRVLRFLVVPVLGDGYVNLYGEDITELRRSMDEIERAREAALAAAGAKSRFLATMSHEIRTPLNAVLGVAELLADTALTDEQQRLLELIETSGRSLLHVIDDVLDFSKIEAGRLTLERSAIEVPGLIEETVISLSVAAQSKGLELVSAVASPGSLALEGDPTRVRQILLNLVGNALKFTSEGSIVVESRVEDASDGNVRLRVDVRDTGPGIPEDKRTSIFDAFAQADDSTTRRFGGTGLGLSISARLAEAMGGRLTVSDNPGGGSCFTLEFPARVTRPRAEDLAHTIPLQGIEVVAIEAQPAAREALSVCLRAQGARVHVFPSVADARQSTALVAPAVVVVSAIDEREAAAAARDLAGWAPVANLPRVLLAPGSALAPAAVLAALGTAMRVNKPWRSGEIAHVVLNAIGLSDGRRAIDADGDGDADTMGRLRVLVAEDHPINRMLATRMLQRAGHEVVSVENGAEAVTAIESGRFDLVLMDVQMPVMDGLDATRAVRRREAVTGHHIPIIALTAFALAGDRERCLEAGMDDYLSKPMRAESLLAAIKRLQRRFAIART